MNQETYSKSIKNLSHLIQQTPNLYITVCSSGNKSRDEGVSTFSSDNIEFFHSWFWIQTQKLKDGRLNL
jgi:hypothetical protein